MQRILTPQRLSRLANGYPLLKDSWYIVTSAALASANQAQEIPRVYQAAVKQISMGKEITAVGVEEEDGDRDLGINDDGMKIASILQETLLKSMIIIGVPKAINSLTILRNALPEGSNKNTNTTREKTNRDSLDEDTRTRKGEEFFAKIYEKVTDRVSANLYRAYPDLHDYVKKSCYGEILSYVEILDAQRTSLAIIGALIPQDVNLQLKGHLRGALNVGNSIEMSNSARDLALQVTEWCGIELKDEPYRLKERVVPKL